MSSVGNEKRPLTKWVLPSAALALFLIGILLTKPFGRELIAFKGAERIGCLAMALAYACVGLGFWLERRSKFLVVLFSLLALMKVFEIIFP